MIGNLYEWVSNTLIGTIPTEFEFIIPIIIIFIVILILYVCFSGVILLHDWFRG